MFHFIFRLLLAFVLLVFFAFVENQESWNHKGWILNVIVVPLLIYHRYTWYMWIVSPILGAYQAALSISGERHLSYLVYVGLLLHLLLPSYRRVYTAPIPLKPYEKEIRELLLKYEPKKLHKVDSELQRYRGKEEQLYNDLVERYTSEDYSEIPDSPMPPSWGSPSPYRQTPPAPGRGSSGTIGDVRTDIAQLFLMKDPAMLSRLDLLMEEYRGREEGLFQSLLIEFEVTPQEFTRFKQRQQQQQLSGWWGDWGAQTSPARSGSRGSVFTEDHEVIEAARREARSAIESRLSAISRRR